MSTLYGVNATKMLTPTGANIIDQGINKSNVCFMYDTYEASAVAANDVIIVCDKLPVGAIVTSIKLVFDDLGAGNTVDVGDGDTADRYMDGIDVATAAGTATYPNETCIAGVGYQVTGEDDDDQLQITILGSTATGTIKILVEYAI
ncbi:MAG: hypothetical protein M0P69_14855 [Bacteroidales bacterium]|nr:hypothetical protein [Bacteroidales bacterium]